MRPDHHRWQVIAGLMLASLAAPAWAIWVVNVKTSPMDGKTSLIIFVKAPKTQREPTLSIQCENRILELVFNARTVLEQTSEGQERPSIRIKYDEAPPRRVFGNRSTDYQAIFIEAPSLQMPALLGAKRVLVEFIPLMKTELIAEFDVAGLSQHLPLLKRHCRF